MTPTPPGVDPGVWARASWAARARWLREHPAPPPPSPPSPPRRDVCPAGHDVTDPANVYRPPSRPGKADCRLCRRERARIRQRERRAAERATRTTSTTTNQETAA